MNELPSFILSDARQRLKAEQSALVRALQGREPAPAGFDVSMLRVMTASLARKRQRGVEKTWPALSAALGEQFGEQFTLYAADTAPQDHPTLDGHDFALWLAARNSLPRPGRIELELWNRSRQGGVRLLMLDDPPALLLAFKWRGMARQLHVPFPRLIRLRPGRTRELNSF